MSIGKQIEFDGIEQAKEDPIVSTIDDNSFEWHGLSTKYMEIGSLILSFEIVQYSHNECCGLYGCVELFFAEFVEEREDDDGAEVLYIEDVLPSDLFP